MTNTYTGNIKQYYLPEFQEKIEKLNKRARKLGCDEVEFTLGEPFKMRVDRGFDQPAILVTKIPVTITMPVIKLSDWQFAARIQPTSNNAATNLIHASPLFNGTVDEKFRYTGNVCEHCNQNRYRKDTYIMHNIITGEQKQVGRQCLRDFLGHDPSKALNFYNFANDIDRNDFFNDTTARDTIEVDTNEVLAYAAAYVRVIGHYTSSKNAYEHDNPATGYLVKRHYTGHTYAEKFPLAIITEDDKKEAEMIKRFALNMTERGDEDDYAKNIKTLINNSSISDRSIAYLVSAIAGYEKAKKEIAAGMKSHVGNIGEKSRFNLTIKKIVCLEGQYGISYLYICEDEHGNQIVYKGTSSAMPCNVEDKVTVEAKVTDHKFYGNKPQTIIQRPKKV